MYPHHVFDLEPAGTFGMYPILLAGKWQVLSTRACNVLKMFSLISRPPRPQCKTARSAQQFDGVLVPSLPGINFEGIVFDEDSVVDPSRVPQVVGAVSSVPKSY